MIMATDWYEVNRLLPSDLPSEPVEVRKHIGETLLSFLDLDRELIFVCVCLRDATNNEKWRPGTNIM
jgi:hypothetical protein